MIPIKQLEDAKQRLAGLLSAEQRRELFQAMVEDVLEAGTSCDSIDEVIVVTRDEVVAQLARRYGADVLTEPEAPGLIAAVTHAAEFLTAAGVEVMIFLPGDIPLVTVEELEVVLDGIGQSGEAEFMIVPASDLGGSNCVVCAPPNCIEFGFGEDSFRRHLRLARERNIEPMVARLPGIGLDVDTPEDLVTLVAELIGKNLQSNTSRFLQESGISEDLSIELKKRLSI